MGSRPRTNTAADDGEQGLGTDFPAAEGSQSQSSRTGKRRWRTSRRRGEVTRPPFGGSGTVQDALLERAEKRPATSSESCSPQRLLSRTAGTAVDTGPRWGAGRLASTEESETGHGELGEMQQERGDEGDPNGVETARDFVRRAGGSVTTPCNCG